LSDGTRIDLVGVLGVAAAQLFLTVQPCGVQHAVLERR
jgi:hypothetical protein